MSPARGSWVRTLFVAGAIGASFLSGQFTRAARAASDPCSLSTLSQPFLPWLDAGRYELLPGGDFEKATWSFASGAQRVRGSEPYAATGKLGGWSLSLPAGSSARSPSVCVAGSEPTIRFFIAGSGTIQVEFVYGGTVIPSGDISGADGWAPTPIVLTGSAIMAPIAGTAEVSVKLTALSGDAQVDDVFIDPWNRG